MELIERAQLRSFVVERLNQIGENLIGLETDRDLEKTAIRLTTLQLLDLAEVLEAIAQRPEVFAFEGSSETTPPSGTLYYEVGADSLYRKCSHGELPKFFHPAYFLRFGQSQVDRTVWRRVSNAEFGLTLQVIRQLTPEEAIAKATILRKAAERFSESFESLEALSTNVTKVFEELEVKGTADSTYSKIESSVFQTESFTTIPTAVAMVSSIYAQLRKDLWQQDQNGLGYFQHRAKGNPNNYVEHYISSPGDVEVLPWEQAEQIIDKFGFTTVKLHLLFAAHTMNQAEPWKSGFVLKGTAILKELGWDKRTDLPMHVKLNEIAKAAFVLDCLLVRTVWIEGRSKQGRLDASTPTGRMWTVVIDPHGQLDVDGKISQPEEIYLGVQPGMIFERFLNKAGSKLKEALYQFGYIAQEVLKIDPYHDELALRMAIHLTMDSRIHPSGKYQVGLLLETILPKALIENARKDSRRAFDLKKRWDKALLLLMQLDWSIEFDESYSELIRPGHKGRNPKGYLETLLAAGITIKPKAPIPELIGAKTELKRIPPQSRPALSLSGAQIRQAREAKEWNQRKLAGWMGVSQSLINHWEKGKRTPNSEQEARLRLVLNIEG
ncbi:helix-turn-helix transcriptional regulator [Trichocoleus sp. FACHB-262]|uniref:helix-turn-helix domain-containing protein n=1 Tax=Trichocoleus sp. FACHB-262 TaxID=2692869 RepID=UPI0018F02F8D|nr:helix-turn-helix transcriptional regulator [Trichocoleus sp. FACHB-262]